MDESPELEKRGLVFLTTPREHLLKKQKKTARDSTLFLKTSLFANNEEQYQPISFGGGLNGGSISPVAQRLHTCG